MILKELQPLQRNISLISGVTVQAASTMVSMVFINATPFSMTEWTGPRLSKGAGNCIIKRNWQLLSTLEKYRLQQKYSDIMVYCSDVFIYKKINVLCYSRHRPLLKPLRGKIAFTIGQPAVGIRPICFCYNFLIRPSTFPIDGI